MAMFFSAPASLAHGLPGAAVGRGLTSDLGQPCEVGADGEQSREPEGRGRVCLSVPQVPPERPMCPAREAHRGLPTASCWPGLPLNLPHAPPGVSSGTGRVQSWCRGSQGTCLSDQALSVLSSVKEPAPASSDTCVYLFSPPFIPVLISAFGGGVGCGYVDILAPNSQVERLLAHLHFGLSSS